MAKNTLSDRIINARKAKNWTQLDLAKALNVNVKNVSRWELGQAKPSLDAAAELANALDTSIDFLAGVKTSTDSSPLLALLAKKVATLSAEQKKALEVVIKAF